MHIPVETKAADSLETKARGKGQKERKRNGKKGKKGEKEKSAKKKCEKDIDLIRTPTLFMPRW
jgi:hypothetical protein